MTVAVVLAVRGGHGGGGGGLGLGGGGSNPPFFGPAANVAGSDTSTGGGSGVSCGACGGGSGGGKGSGDAGGGGSGCCDGGSGMTIWEVSEPYINLWLYDAPLGYQPGLGPKISFRLSYKQRDARFLYTGVSGNYTGVGPQWNCSWVSYLYRNFTITTNGDGTFTTNYDGTATAVMGDGGQRTFTADGATLEYYSQGTLTDTANPDGSWNTATIIYPDNSTEVYSTVTAGPLRVSATEILYLTARYDRFGNGTRFYYESYSPLLQYVVDADGRTNTLSYTGSLITSVQDPVRAHGHAAIRCLRRVDELHRPGGPEQFLHLRYQRLGDQPAHTVWQHRLRAF